MSNNQIIQYTITHKTMPEKSGIPVPLIGYSDTGSHIH